MSTSIAMMDKAGRILCDVFGFDAFRNGQRDIVSATLSGQDVIGVLPTGGGKSICYQVPALVFPKMTLVVSPLIALMKDQTERLQQRGVSAFALHGGVSQGDVNDILFRASQGGVKLLYVAPERLESSTFRRQLHSIPLSLLAVDEAHCVSEWGHDFRPSYRNILSIFETRQRVPIIAVTATATPDVRTDIAAVLQLRKPIEIVRGFSRPNLAFNVVQTAAKVEHVTQQARALQGNPMIVYAASRRRVETMSSELIKRGITAAPYHGGMPAHQRAATQDAFLADSMQVLVATNAFGMGIDKPDVRQVIHADLTLTLEAYYQEAGRAGRDGKPSICTLLYKSEDKRLMNFYIETTYPEKSQVAQVYDYLCTRAGILHGQANQTPLMADAASIASALHTTEAGINGVLSLMQRSGVILSVSPQGSATISLRTSHERLQQFVAAAPIEYASALQLIERALQGKQAGYEISMPVVEMLRRSDVTPSEFARAIQALQLAQLVRYTAPNTGGGILVLGERVNAGALPIDYSALSQRRDRAVQKLNVMVSYAESRQCKRNFILSYFGDTGVQGTCGICSSCVNQSTESSSLSARTMEHVQSVLQTAWQLKGTFGRHVVVDILRGVYSQKVQEYALDRCAMFATQRSRSKSELLEAIDVALDQGWLVKSADLYPTIGVSANGRQIMSSSPKQLTLKRLALRQPGMTEAPSSVSSSYSRLRAMRERVSQARGVAEQSMCSDDELQAIAADAPASLQDLMPGRHGSSLFLTQYADDILACIDRAASEVSQAHEADTEVAAVVALLQEYTTLDGLSEHIKMSKTALVVLLQRAIESGVDIQRGNLVDDVLYSSVKEYVRFHRYAKLRDLRDHIGGEPPMPELRLALSLARRDLFSQADLV
ncbi:MAG: RecQ family ATP-dependent DNA helicase [Ignavibacteria bacterium]|jgi:ATP-dependent DNA helicase RecQ